MKTNPNDSAYPQPNYSPEYSGLTKREEFAARAMQGLLASRTIKWGERMDYVQCAYHSVQFADALFNALDQEKA